MAARKRPGPQRARWQAAWAGGRNSARLVLDERYTTQTCCECLGLAAQKLASVLGSGSGSASSMARSMTVISMLR